MIHLYYDLIFKGLLTMSVYLLESFKAESLMQFLILKKFVTEKRVCPNHPKPPSPLLPEAPVAHQYKVLKKAEVVHVKSQ